jgi:flavin reductase
MAEANAGADDLVDLAKFKDAMSRVAAAVHIVATDGPAGLGGITATAVTSITVEPPSLLFCINRTSPSAQRIIENGVFTINTLSPADQAISDVFAGRTDQHLEDRFKSGVWTKLVTGAPVLSTAVASFDCRVTDVKTVTTHEVIIGRVVAVQYGPEGESLGYVHRKYKSF